MLTREYVLLCCWYKPCGLNTPSQVYLFPFPAPVTLHRDEAVGFAAVTRVGVNGHLYQRLR